jgi:hypothetical protein
VRPFRAWGYPWSAWFVLAGAAAFLVGVLAGDRPTAVLAVALLVLGLVIHGAIVKLSPATSLASRGIESNVGHPFRGAEPPHQ